MASLGSAISLGEKLGIELAKILFGSETYTQVVNHADLTYNFTQYLLTPSNGLLPILNSRREYNHIAIVIKGAVIQGTINDSCGCGSQCESGGSCACTGEYDRLRGIAVEKLLNYIKVKNSTYGGALRMAEEWLLAKYFQDFTDVYLKLRKEKEKEMRDNPARIEEYLEKYGNSEVQADMSKAIDDYINTSLSYLR